MKAKAQYRVNWNNGQVQSVTSKAEGLKLINGDVYGEFARVQRRLGSEDWETVARISEATAKRHVKAKIAADTKARIEAAQAETRAVVASGKCPCCGSGIRRNLSIAGWHQCEQYGAEGFRKDSTKPPCSWQGFTE